MILVIRDHMLFKQAKRYLCIAMTLNNVICVMSALAKVTYDSRLTMQQHAFGLNTSISRVQGGKLTTKKKFVSLIYSKDARSIFADDRGA